MNSDLENTDTSRGKSDDYISQYLLQMGSYSASFNFIPREEVGILKGAGVKHLLKTGRLRQELDTQNKYLYDYLTLS